jgi:4-amino-4-deoxy-L-arabinose transferase-like glycosyltransferase
VLVCLLAHAALIFGAYRLGADVFGRWSGLLAAAFVGASASFLLYAARGYVDSVFLALVVWAAAFEAARGGRDGVFALSGGLLALAGLLRPEAWVLAGLYAVWGWRRANPRERAILAGALVLPPLIWGLVDASVTGDPLHSFHATTELADELDREQGIGAVPGSFVSFIGATVRPPVAVLAIVGAVIAWWHPGRGALRVPAALFACGVATFVGTGILGLSIIPRYLTVPAVALCLFAGHALAGFTTLPSAHPLRRRWARASGTAAVLGVAVLAILAPSLGRITDELSFLRATHDSLVALVDDPRVRTAMRCGPVTFPNYRLVPDSRWHLDAPRSAVGARSALRRRRGVAVFALTRKGLRRLGFADGASPTTNVPDPGFDRIVVNARFSAYAACG